MKKRVPPELTALKLVAISEQNNLRLVSHSISFDSHNVLQRYTSWMGEEKPVHGLYLSSPLALDLDKT